MKEIPLPLRQLLNLIVPIVILWLLPAWLLHIATPGDSRWHSVIGRILAIVVGIGGLALFTWCFWLFVRRGKGTVMPWDPTVNMVAAGPYAFTRNPMISAMILMLAA